MKKRFSKVMALLMAASIMAAIPVSAADADLKVGFSELDIDGAWRICQTDSMQEEADARGYNYVMTNAEYDTEKQVADVEDLIAQGCNFLFIAPIDLDAVEPKYMTDREKKVLNDYHELVYNTIAPYLTEEEREWLKVYTRPVA